jgi:hypothetical protein
VSLREYSELEPTVDNFKTTCNDDGHFLSTDEVKKNVILVVLNLRPEDAADTKALTSGNLVKSWRVATDIEGKSKDESRFCSMTYCPTRTDM